MKTEINAEPRIEETSRRTRRELSKFVASDADIHPFITCECALWGPPYPHFLWSERSAHAQMTSAIT